MWLVATCHVMSCHVMWCDVVVMSFDVMWFFVMCHVTWCNAMSCDVLSSVVLCNGMIGCEVTLCGSKWICDDVVIQSTTLYLKVLECTSMYYEVLLRTTKYYSVLQSTTPYYKVPLRTTPYYKVLQCIKKYHTVLLCTTLYYNLLLRTAENYNVLQSITPYYKVLLCTTKCYSVLRSITEYYNVLLCTTPYYKVLLGTTKYYSVLQKALHSTTLYYKVLHSMSPRHMKRPVQCAEQQESSSNFTKYWACHEKWLWWWTLISNETSSTMRGATGVILQLHQILRLPRKMTLMMEPYLKWNVQYNARRNRSHHPTAPNTARATRNDSHDWSLSHVKRPVQCAEHQESNSNLHQIYCACHKIFSWRFQRKIPELLPAIERRFADNPSMIRPWSDDDPRIKSSSRTRRFGDLTCPFLETRFVWKNTTFRAPAISQNFTKCCACHEKWRSKSTKYCACHKKSLSWLKPLTNETSFTMRGASRATL